MDTKDLINFKKQRIQEEIQKIIPPGFSWSAYPTEKERQKYSPNRAVAEENWREFLGQDLDLIMQVGYIKPTKLEYTNAIGNLRFFGGKLSNYKDFINSGPFFGDSEGSKNFEEACDYIVRFYDLTKIIVRRAEEEQKASLKRKNLKEEEKKENQSSEKQKKATKFISGATNFRPGKRVAIKSTKLSGIIPKKPIPSTILDKISKPAEESNVEESNVEDSIDAPKRVVSVFGKLTLDLVQINDNLDKIREIIVEDYKRTKEKNKEETKDFRKRVAERSKKIGKRELGDNKKDLKGIVKKYTGSFFSGTGGAIRALSLFKMVEALVNGNPIDALGPLLGIGATYLPAIAQAIGGIIAAKVIGGIFRPGRGVPGRGLPRRGSPRGGVPGRGLPRVGKFSKLLALGAGSLALGGAFINKINKDDDSSIQKKLDEINKEQKESISPEDLNQIPESDLKKFKSLNNKFEESLDFLMKSMKDEKKKNEDNNNRSSGSAQSSSGGLNPGGGAQIPEELLNSDMNPNMAGYLTRLSYLETRIRNIPNQQGSGAEGFFQAKDPFTEEAIRDSGGLSPRSSNFATASKSVMAWIYKNKRAAYDAILEGDYDSADRLLKGVWPSLPGGDQSQEEAVQIKAREYLKGGRSYSRNMTNDTISQTRREFPSVETSPLSSSLTVLPVPIQQKSEKLPASTTDAGNLVVNNVSTTYSDNYYSLYSKLIYQIV
jgi:hypothetical protein